MAAERKKAIDGASRAGAMKTLRDNGLVLTEHMDHSGMDKWWVKIFDPRTERVRAEYLPPEISRATVNRLAEHYKIPKPLFYSDPHKKPN